MNWLIVLQAISAFGSLGVFAALIKWHRTWVLICERLGILWRKHEHEMEQLADAAALKNTRSYAKGIGLGIVLLCCCMPARAQLLHAPSPLWRLALRHTVDRKLAAVWAVQAAPIGADIATTVRNLGHGPGECYETNPALGPYPSNGHVIRYGAQTYALSAGGTFLLKWTWEIGKRAAPQQWLFKHDLWAVPFTTVDAVQNGYRGAIHNIRVGCA